MMSMFRQVLRYYSATVRLPVHAMTGLAGISIAAMTVITTIDVISRALWRPLPGAYDLVTIFGAAGALILAVCRRRLTWRGLDRALRETARTSCMVLLIVAGAMMFGQFLTVTNIPLTLATWLGGLPLPAWLVMAGIILFFLIGGCFVDALALILLTIPIFLPSSSIWGMTRSGSALLSCR